ncbi:MAG: PAS domain-containing sensor histidine kinase [Bacteroidota bacterium]
MLILKNDNRHFLYRSSFIIGQKSNNAVLCSQSMDSIEHTARLNAIFNTVIDGIITIDEKGVIESVNPAAAKIFGYQPEELVHQKVNLLMPMPHSRDHDDYIENYLTTGLKKIIGIGREVQGKKKDGTEFPFRLSISEADFGHRKIFTGIIHDLTDLRQAEKALEENQNRLSAIFDTAVDGIITIDRQGIMEMINPAAAKMFGYQVSDLVGKNVKTLMPEPHFSRHDGYISNYHKTGVKKIIGIGREVEGKRKDGSTFPINLGVSKVPLGDRVIYTGIIHDISKEKAAQEKVEKLNAELEQRVEERTEKLAEVVNKLLKTNKQLANEIQERKAAQAELEASREQVKTALQKERELSELKSRFVSMASHEFRTPLSTIQSSASLISRYKGEEHDEKREKHVNRIKSAVRNLTGILNDFLSLSRLEEGKINQSPSSFNLVDLAGAVSDELHTILKKDQEIRLHTDQDNLEVYLDRHFLKNVMINLLSNAIKYSDQGKMIDLKLEVGDDIRITVKDEGIGIPETEQHNLFERFFRANNVTNIQGTGLGLNIVKKYVEMMAGKIEFSSQVNIGSTFIVILPKLDPSAP